MGFKFFKKKKEEELPELPPLDDSYLPEFPDLKLPELPKERDLELPPFPEESELPPLPKEKSLEFPSFPQFPKGFKPKSVEEIKRAVGEVEHKKTKSVPEPRKFNYPMPVERTFEEPKPIERFIAKPEPVQRALRPVEPAPRPILLEFAKRDVPVKKVRKMFIEVGHYKVLLNAMGSIKINIVDAGNSLTRIEDISKSQQESLEKWQSCLDTIQKKIIEVDKNLFK